MTTLHTAAQAPGEAQAAAAIDKREATQRARAALIGATLIRTENDAGQVVFVLTRWHLTRELQSPDEVDDLLDAMGAPD